MELHFEHHCIAADFQKRNIFVTQANGTSRWSWLWPVLTLILAVLLILLSYQNIQLEKELVRYSQLIPSGDIQKLDENDIAPNITAFLPDGQEITIRTDSLYAPLVLVWYSEDCAPCDQALESWNDLARSYPGQVWGVSRSFMSAIPDLKYGDNVFFPIVTPLNDSLFDLYRAEYTPQTMVVKKDGRIGYVWLGPPTEEDIEEITMMMGEPYRKEVNE